MNALTLTGLQHAQVDLAPDAMPRRDAALKIAAAVAHIITDAMEAEEAADALRVLSPLCREVEALRAELKKPVLALGRKIDATAHDYITPVEVEKLRIASALGRYQAVENERAAHRRAEAEREARRLQFESAQAASVARDEAAQQAAEQAAEQAALARAEAAQIVAPRPEGVSVRHSWKYEVSDIIALYKARPDLCVIEPNAAAIRAQIPYTTNQGIPGLRIWQEAIASV